MMTFVNISLLGGTALIALPIVLHLIMRQRPKRFEFPALRFVQQRHETNQRRLRLRHLLLLLLRVAAIALLAFALAQPSVKFSGVLGSREAPVAAALVFDAAPRMDYRQNNRTRLEAARELGQWLLAQLPAESQIAVLDTRLGPGAFQVDAQQQIERLAAVPNSRPVVETVEEAARLLGESELERKELYVFTDLARGAWPADAGSALRGRLGELDGVGIYVIDVGVENPVNYGLGELRLSAQVLSSRSPLSVDTDLSCSGAEGTRAVELLLAGDDGTMQKRSEQSHTIESGEAKRVEFRIGSLGEGTHQGLVRLVGQDGLEADDVRYFTVEVTPPWRVLIAAPEPAERNALFLSEALAPEMMRRQGLARFECRVLSLAELAGQPLGDYAAVLLLDPRPLEPALWRKLADYASDGNGVGVFLGRNALPIEPFNAAVAQELLPGKLLRQARSPDGDNYLAPRSYEHPILAEFRGIAGAVPWHLSPVFRYWELGELNRGAGVVIRYLDGRPALVERPIGSGRSLCTTTPVSDDPNRDPWNLLPVSIEPGQQWPFVILANQIAAYLIGSVEAQLNHVAGQAAVLSLDPDLQTRNYLLTAPDGLKFTLTADLKQDLLVITSTDQVGNYRVEAAGGFQRGFSVNLAPRQTELARLPIEELKEIFGPFEFRVAESRQEIDRDISTGRVGRELFPPLMLLLAVVLAGEMLVSNRFYRE